MYLAFAFYNQLIEIDVINVLIKCSLEQVEGSDSLKNRDTKATQSGIRDTPVYDNIVFCEAEGLVLPGWAVSSGSDGRKT